MKDWSLDQSALFWSQVYDKFERLQSVIILLKVVSESRIV